MQAYLDRNMFPDPAVAREVDATDSAGGLGNTGESSQALFERGLARYRFKKYGSISMPVLLIAGERDLETPPELQKDLAKQLPHAKVIVYPAGGHLMFAEQPARFGSDVSNFLAAARRSHE